MKKGLSLILSNLLCIALLAQVSFKSVQINPLYPAQGKSLSIEYDAATTILKNEKDIALAVYLFSGKGLKVLEPTLNKVGNSYRASINVDTNTNCIAFTFTGGEQLDNNFGKGYVVPVYNSAKKPVAGYYTTAGSLNSGYGEYLFGMTSEPDKSLALMEEGLSTYPASKDDQGFMGTYLFTLSMVKKKDAEPLIKQYLDYLEEKPVRTESEYGTLTQWYTKLKQRSVADSFTALMKAQYPSGGWKKTAALDKVMKEKDPVLKQSMLNDFLTAYPPTDAEKPMLYNVQSQIAGGYARNKNYTAFREAAAKLPAAERYSLYNSLAWNMAEKETDVTEAEAMAKEATEWTKAEAFTPSGKKPDQMTARTWEKKRKEDYAMYGDTYAFILYNRGAYKEGLPYAKDAATINNLNDAELNERYGLLLEKAAPAEEAIKTIEVMVQNGKATGKVKDALKNLYGKSNPTGDFDSYLSKLEAAAKEKKREEVTKTMINEPAPKFTLKDFEGKAVSLESLKGKVVVVDFWATWCGPCIASMPGMKKAQEKLTGRGDVAFLFIDTWENVADKKKNAMDFMKKKNFPFYVLMDDDNSVVANFNVTGIPAKFIIDKAGNIRFKATGFNGNEDDLVDELSLMVDLASK
jgi:peroxiredoxin